MNLSIIGCSYRTAPVELREKLAIDEAVLPRAMADLASRYGCETVVISTCNRVEFYLASPDRTLPFDPDLIAEFLGEYQQLSSERIRPHFYEYRSTAAVTHLFRVASSLDSLVLGEGQIAGQVKKSFELAQQNTVTGPLLNTLFNHAIRAAKRVRTETGITQGHVSVSSVAVDYVRQVFDHFGDKTILVIGAGKMGRLTLIHLRELKPKRILITNRSPEKALSMARDCHGEAVPWEQLDHAIAQADIILSTTGSPELIVSRERYDRIAAQRTSTGTVVILDIAVPRDFDPAIHDGDRTCLFNIDDLERVREQTLGQRKKHIAPAERIIEEEQRKFVEDWSRRRNGPIIEKLMQECDAKRDAVLKQLLSRLNGKLTDADREFIEGAFRRFQNQLLHAPIDALRQEAKEGSHGILRDALRKLFRLEA